MLFAKFIGLLWVPFGVFGTWATIESAPRSPFAWAAGAFFAFSAFTGLRLFRSQRFALPILCLQSAIIVPILLLGAMVADYPGGGGMSWIGILLLLLAASTLMFGFVTAVRRRP
jgi:hypothetical protein